MNKASMSTTSSSDQENKIVEQAKQAVTHVASDMATQAREQVNTQFDARKDKAVETMGNVASAIRETGEKLKGVGPLGDVAGRAADGIEQVADFFEGKQIGDVVRDVERFARREPAIFMGAAFALGLIGGRFLKSSAHRSTGIGQYALRGGGVNDRYAAFGDDGYLSDADLEDEIESRRFDGYGAQRPGYGAQRPGRGTLPFGSPMGSTSMGSRGSSAGSSPRATPGTSSQATSSFGSSSVSPAASPAESTFGSGVPAAVPGASSASATSSTPSATSALKASVPPSPLTSSASAGATTPKDGVGSGNSGNKGSA